MKLYFKNFEIYHNTSIYVFYFPGAAAEPLGSARGALRAPLGLRGAQVGNLWYKVCRAGYILLHDMALHTNNVSGHYKHHSSKCQARCVAIQAQHRLHHHGTINRDMDRVQSQSVVQRSSVQGAQERTHALDRQ
jgi:hypothetical protein